MAHAGYLAEAILYLLMGAFALLAAFDAREHPKGTQGALARLGGTSAGKLLLAAMVIGLAAFVAWQLLVAFRDPEHRRERDRRYRLISRMGDLFNGVLYSALVITALRSLFGLASTTSSENTQTQWIARALRVPLGRYAVAATGIGIALYGVYQGVRGLTRLRDSRVDLTRTRLRPLIDALVIYGMLARGLLFALIGGYLIDAAWQFNARYSVGVAGAFAVLRQRPYGGWLLGIVATGLVAYGIGQILKEPYRLLRDS